jgi:excisionase family DNA binding protein
MINRRPRRSGKAAPRRRSHAIGTAVHHRPVAKLLTIEETTQVLNASPRTVRRAIDSGALPVHRIGRLVRISEADLAGFLNANRTI